MHNGRIRKLRVDDYPDSLARHEYFFLLHFPNLASCCIINRHDALPDGFLSLGTPLLRHLTIKSCNFDREKMTKESIVQNLVHFEVSSASEKLTVTLKQILGALERMPLLETLILDCAEHFLNLPCGDTSSSTLRSVSLDYLIRLQLKGTVRNVKMLLSRIRFPPASQSRVGVNLCYYTRFDDQDLSDVVAWLAHYLAPAAETGEIDRLVYRPHDMEVYTGPKRDVLDSPTLRLHWSLHHRAEYLLCNLLLSQSPLEGIRTFELAVADNIPYPLLP
jgi:hypothetical protein